MTDLNRKIEEIVKIPIMSHDDINDKVEAIKSLLKEEYQSLMMKHDSSYAIGWNAAVSENNRILESKIKSLE